MVRSSIRRTEPFVVYTVAITGGIGSGKSAVADRFAWLGVPVIDADVIAREVTAPGKPALAQILSEFGQDLASKNGSLDRAALRKIVFSDSSKRKRLEKIVHPCIHREITDALSALGSAYAVLVIPLLAESKRKYPIDRVVVVDVPQNIQIERVTARDNQSVDEVKKIISSQASRDERLAIADDVFVNTGSIEMLNVWVDQMHRRYVDYAKQLCAISDEQAR